MRLISNRDREERVYLGRYRAFNSRVILSVSSGSSITGTPSKVSEADANVPCSSPKRPPKTGEWRPRTDWWTLKRVWEGGKGGSWGCADSEGGRGRAAVRMMMLPSVSHRSELLTMLGVSRETDVELDSASDLCTSEDIFQVLRPG